MKTTKEQLKRIIKEEKRKLHEQPGDQHVLLDAEDKIIAALDEFVMIYDEYLGYDVPEEKIRAKLNDIISEVLKMQEYPAREDR